MGLARALQAALGIGELHGKLGPLGLDACAAQRAFLKARLECLELAAHLGLLSMRALQLSLRRLALPLAIGDASAQCADFLLDELHASIGRRARLAQ